MVKSTWRKVACLFIVIFFLTGCSNIYYVGRQKPVENDYYSFIYKWFANADRLSPASVFKTMIKRDFSIVFPDKNTLNTEAFLNWYSSLQKTFVSSRHTIKSMSINHITDQSAIVDILFTAESINKEGKKEKQTYHEKWSIMKTRVLLQVANIEILKS